MGRMQGQQDNLKSFLRWATALDSTLDTAGVDSGF